MPAWISLSLSDLNSYLVGAQVNALNTAALAAGQSDRFTGIMTDMVNRIRVKIEGCPRNHISATPLTIPPELKWVACYLIIEAMQTAVPGLKLTDDQRNQIAKADDQLTRIADCKEVVSIPNDPLTPADVQRGGQTATRQSHPAPGFSQPNSQRPNEVLPNSLLLDARCWIHRMAGTCPERPASIEHSMFDVPAFTSRPTIRKFMSILASIQQQCADRLQSDPLFANVPVLTERIADIQSEIDRALGPLNEQGGKTGLVAILLTPTANVNFENIFGPFFDEIKIVVRIMENVTVNQDPTNGTNVAAADAAEKICNLLHHFQPDSANGPITAQKPAISLGHDPQHLCYDCHFKASGGLTSVPTQAATPVITSSAGAFTLTCATTGAAIFYTLDGSNPMPRNGVFYTAPFTPGAGLTLKARAWLAGYLASAITTVNT